MQVSEHREDDALFLSLVPPHKPVVAGTLARWLARVLEMAGVDTAVFAPHATRSASAAYLKTVKRLSVKAICKIADWSSLSPVFKKFYDRYYVD